jgi:hypothetical protein
MVSSKMAPAASSKEAPRQHFFHPKRREEHGGYPPDIRAFTLDFKLALDQFRVRLFFRLLISAVPSRSTSAC